MFHLRGCCWDSLFTLGVEEGVESPVRFCFRLPGSRLHLSDALGADVGFEAVVLPLLLVGLSWFESMIAQPVSGAITQV